jgi:hypothetical protein
LHVRSALRVFGSALAIICIASLLLSCGGGSIAPPTLMLIPTAYTITVNTSTGTVTGATPIQATLDGKPVDITTVGFAVTSTNGVSPSCMGIDQTGTPRCNAGCGTSFNGVITGSITTPVITTATTTISCTFQ